MRFDRHDFQGNREMRRRLGSNTVPRAKREDRRLASSAAWLLLSIVLPINIRGQHPQLLHRNRLPKVLSRRHAGATLLHKFMTFHDLRDRLLGGRSAHRAVCGCTRVNREAFGFR
jgi:hypothetical protein